MSIVAEEVRLTRPRVFEQGTREVASPGPGEALIRVTECGICGSDLKMYGGGHPVHRPPLLLGHELIGEVAALPGGYEGALALGTPVAVYPAINCGRCHACRAGKSHICPRMRLIGGHEPGGMSQFVIAPEYNLVPIPEEMPPGLAVLTEPMAVAVHGVNRGRVEAGETTLVVGCGPVGLMTAMVLRQLGTTRVVVSDIAAGPLSRARDFGFEDVIDGSTQDLGRALANMGFEEGVDVVFDCAGATDSPETGLRTLVPGGRLVLVGVPPAKIALDSVLLQRGERDIVGSMLYTPAEFEEAMELLASGIIPETALAKGMVRSEYRLGDSPEAFELLASGDSPVLKLVIVHDAPDGP